MAQLFTPVISEEDFEGLREAIEDQYEPLSLEDTLSGINELEPSTLTTIVPFNWTRFLVYSLVGGASGYLVCGAHQAYRNSRSSQKYEGPVLALTAVGASLGALASVLVTITERQELIYRVMTVEGDE